MPNFWSWLITSLLEEGRKMDLISVILNFKCMVAENCGKIVDDLLKIPFAELKYLPHDILSDKRYVNMINDCWNKNVLLI